MTLTTTSSSTTSSSQRSMPSSPNRHHPYSQQQHSNSSNNKHNGNGSGNGNGNGSGNGKHGNNKKANGKSSLKSSLHTNSFIESLNSSSSSTLDNVNDNNNNTNIGKRDYRREDHELPDWSSTLDKLWPTAVSTVRRSQQKSSSHDLTHRTESDSPMDTLLDAVSTTTTTTSTIASSSSSSGASSKNGTIIPGMEELDTMLLPALNGGGGKSSVGGSQFERLPPFYSHSSKPIPIHSIPLLHSPMSPQSPPSTLFTSGSVSPSRSSASSCSSTPTSSSPSLHTLKDTPPSLPRLSTSSSASGATSPHSTSSFKPSMPSVGTSSLPLYIRPSTGVKPTLQIQTPSKPIEKPKATTSSSTTSSPSVTATASAAAATGSSSSGISDGVHGNSKKSSQYHCTISSDGYQWRKYGQKNVKGTSFPRSYYKCTYPGCKVKKQLEKRADSDEFHIQYKGEHTHGSPLTTRVNVNDQDSFKNSVISEGVVTSTSTTSTTTTKTTTSTTSTSSSTNDIIIKQEVQPHSKGTDNTTVQNNNNSNNSNQSQQQTMHPSPSTKSHPKLVIETSSLVDYMDDGFTWRKYGQKAVKGSPFPKSYFKCSERGCNVKRQVVQQGDTKFINTYSGRHTHDPPPPAPIKGEGEHKKRRRKEKVDLPVEHVQDQDKPMIESTCDAYPNDHGDASPEVIDDNQACHIDNDNSQ
ncbi:hypothetical protein SAMD00019534_006220 [Acytostelium subglobosum LB1]|uniref:hypothetical protein n=1 Tax=Acytostelium subglobosum LB1 TaxID=1410327 RepID=UPI000644D420|nr:hypothetical protein SAMD00019534_006220 [Acytostelium subglobosum LB1]GAM17447.1 hypothetical protein SAMD00019534_006220 [Acytostelium subglobosum LB1]|eukprot:XP_012759509.1 hypothetical protein SAMD00019534_006220 [Acytostelium subglobosum LB1]